MNREDFEILVSEWLDEPERAGLRAAIDAALGANAEFAAIFGEWTRFDGLLRRGLPAPAVNWSELQRAIGDGLRYSPTESSGAAASDDDSSNADDRAENDLDTLIAGQTRHAGVDWDRLRATISDSVASAGARARPPRVIRFFAWSAVGLAAAAALVFAVLRPFSMPARPDATAIADVARPGAAATGRSGADLYAESPSADRESASAPDSAGQDIAKSVVLAAVVSADRGSTNVAGRVSASISELGAAESPAEESAAADDEPRRFVMIDALDAADGGVWNGQN